MICPCCQSSAIILELYGVEIDYCPACGGIWLDAGELETLLGSKSAEMLPAFQKERSSREKKLRCPACGKRMEKVMLGKTRLDRCPQGHGLWFDKGELAEIIAAADVNSQILHLLQEMFKNEINQ